MTTKLFDLTEKVAIVTGAGKGLGKVLAKGLAEFGAKVVVCDRIVENANQVEWAEKNIRVNAIAPGYLENIMQGAEAEHTQSDKQTQICHLYTQWLDVEG